MYRLLCTVRFKELSITIFAQNEPCDIRDILNSTLTVLYSKEVLPSLDT